MKYGRTALTVLLLLALSGLAGAQGKTLRYLRILLTEARTELPYHELERVQALLAGANALIDDTWIETCPSLADAKPLLEEAISAVQESMIHEALDEIDALVATCESLTFDATTSGLGQIAFVSDQDQDGLNELYVMTADGATQKRLTASSSESETPEQWNVLEPAWSPDGTQIAFTSKRDIYILDVNTLEIRMIMDNGTSPAWSPDGTQIVFTSQRNNSLDIYVMSADGSNVERLKKDVAEDHNPVWSPDGTQIVFASYMDGGGLYIMSADGTDVKRLTAEGVMSENAISWSPDGTQIAFDGYFNDRTHIAVINSDGTDLRVLTEGQGPNESPVWSPDGRQIAFTSYVEGDSEIYVMDADGGNMRALTSNFYNAFSPSWGKASDQPE